MFSIISETKIEKGIFFRSPIQKVQVETYLGEAYSWVDNAKRLVIPYLLNMDKYSHFKEIIEDDDLAGLVVRVFASPIYFKRYVRTAIHKFKNHPDGLLEIRVFGEEPFKNNCSGACICEKAIFVFDNEKKETVKTYGSFHYYYKHVVEAEFGIK